MKGESSRTLLLRARAGDAGALDLLFARHLEPLQRWAHGRLPRWARTWSDTADLVQDALLKTVRRLDRFQPAGKGALRAYLCRAVDHRIHDELRRIARRGVSPPLDEYARDPSPSPLDAVIAGEAVHRYRAGLAQLRRSDRRLIVARVELGYSYEQLALIGGLRRADSARVALHRALVRLAREMSHA